MKRYLIAFLILLTAVIFLYKDIILNGKKFNASDIRQWRNSAQVSIEYKKKNPNVEDVLWNPNMFGGMPNFAISYSGKVSFIDQWLSRPLSFLKGQGYYTFIFACFIFFLIRMQTQRFDIAFSVAAISVFLPNFVSLFEAGHNSKAYTSVLFAALLLSFIKTIESKKWFWGLIFSIFVAFSFRTAHPQIIYYGLLSLSIFGIYYLFSSSFHHSVQDKVKVSTYFIVGILLALALYALTFIPVKEYMHETIRGGGGLNASAGKSGLSYDYANGWSLHPMELLTLLNPSYFGLFSEKYGVAGLYWGWMQFTTTSFYMGVMLIPLSLLGILKSYKKPLSIALLLTMGMALVIAFGKHNFVPFLNEFMLDYIPYYNKFRSPNVSMTFVQVILFLFAAYGLKDLITSEKETQKKFYMITSILIAFLLLSLLFSDALSFTKDGEAQRYGKNLSQIISLRQALFSTSNMMSLALLVILLGSSYAFFNKKIKVVYFLAIISIVSIFDLYRYDKAYMGKLVVAKNWSGQFGNKSETDQFLLQDKDQFRVLPMGNLFDDARWSYYHENLGGYSAAKLSRFQTLLEQARLNQFPNLALASMMNAKYFLYQVKNQQQLNQITNQFKKIGLQYRHLDKKTGILSFENPFVRKRLWLPDSVISMADEKAILTTVTKVGFNPQKRAYVLNYPNTGSQAEQFSYSKEHYDVHQQSYQVEVGKDAFVAVSEIYYPVGWKAFIDGEEIEIYETNFFIRGVKIPKGKHLLEFRFEPESYKFSKLLSTSASYIYYLLILFALLYYRKEILERLKLVKF